MADYLNNVLTADAYTAALTLGPNFRGASAIVTVAGNPARFQVATGQPGNWGWLDDRDMLAPAGPDTINSFKISKIIGIRFKSANPGAAAQILCTLSDNDADPLFEAGFLSSGTVSPSGVVTETKVVTGNVGGAGTIGSGTGYTVNKTGTGVYVITFTTPFASVPIFIATLNGVVGMIEAEGVGPTGLTLRTFNAAGAAADGAFFFYAQPAV